MPHVFLATPGAARALLVLHAFVAFALLGATTHLTIVSIQLWRRRLGRVRLVRIYSQVIGATFVVAFVVGLVMYPHYRYHVRGLYLDRYENWASNLFDMKETFAALGLPFALGLFAVGRRLDATTDAALVPFVAISSAVVWFLVAIIVIAGLVVTSVRGV